MVTNAKPNYVSLFVSIITICVILLMVTGTVAFAVKLFRWISGL